MGHWETFSKLPRPSAIGFFSVEARLSTFRVARSYANTPTLLIEFRTLTESVPRRLTNLAYAPPAPVDVTDAGGRTTSPQLAILECRSDEPELGAYFFRLANAMLIENTSAQDEGGFDRALEKLVLLFRALQRPGGRPLQGLWAELAVVFWATKPESALSAWHSRPSDLHDFGTGPFRLEVKSSQRGLREHHFRLAQLATVESGVTVVASVLLREASDGFTVHDLVDGILARLNRAPEAAERLEVIVAESLGANWRDASEIRFSVADAYRSLRFYDAADIPSIPLPLPLEVKDVHFVVDISGVAALSFAAVRSFGTFFSELVAPQTSEP